MSRRKVEYTHGDAQRSHCSTYAMWYSNDVFQRGGGSSAMWGKFYKGIAVPEEPAATRKSG